MENETRKKTYTSTVTNDDHHISMGEIIKFILLGLVFLAIAGLPVYGMIVYNKPHVDAQPPPSDSLICPVNLDFFCNNFCIHLKNYKKQIHQPLTEILSKEGYNVIVDSLKIVQNKIDQLKNDSNYKKCLIILDEQVSIVENALKAKLSQLEARMDKMKDSIEPSTDQDNIQILSGPETINESSTDSSFGSFEQSQ